MSLTLFQEFQTAAVPFAYVCPISWRVMSDPVIDSRGISYDKASIHAWGANGFTNAPGCTYQLGMIIENRALRNIIEEYKLEVPNPSNVVRSLWASDTTVRRRMYGESAQWFNPATPYSDLERLEDGVKKTVEQVFLATVDCNPNLTAPLHIIEAALRRYCRAYPTRAPHDSDARIARERASRWPV